MVENRLLIRGQLQKLKERGEWRGFAADATVTRNGNGPLENIRKLQGLVDRLLPPDLPIVRFLERIQPPSYGTTLANNFETLNRQSALFEATQSILAQPTMLKQLEALATPADSIERLVDRALLPDRHGLAAMAERMAKQVELFRTAGIAETAWSQLLERQMAAVQMSWLNPHSARAVV